MATYYARNVTGNYNANTSWDSASSGGAGPAGPPTSSDTIIFDSGYTGSLTVTAAAACAVLTCQSGAAGTLTINSAQTLIAYGNVAFVSTMTLAGASGNFAMSGTGTYTPGGQTLPGNCLLYAGTRTLAGDLSVAGTLTLYPSAGTPYYLYLAGAYDISCANLIASVTTTIKLVSGQNLNVTASITAGEIASTITIQSTTASSSAYLNYTGTAANCKMVTMTLIDIDASGSSQGIDNWYGGTLTRCSGITNRTSADFATAAQASKILDDTTISGVTGTIATQTLSAANDTVAAGYYAATTLAAVDADLAAGNIKSGVTIFGVAGSYAGGGGGRPEIRGGNL